MLRKSAVWLLNSALVLALLAGLARGDDPAKPAAKSAEDKAYEELAQQVVELERLSRAFESIAKLVAPAVVHIQSKRATTFMEKNFTYEETGSGVIIRLPGGDAPYVLTNHHVIESQKPEQLEITTFDGRVVHAVRGWSDKDSDVAVLAIAERDVPAARLGDSDKLEVGHWVLAIGSPFDQAGSVTHGIISGKGRRSLRLGGSSGVLNQDFLQTDAPINPGNSGGPLVNLRGEIVGINTAIASQSGGSEGVGFSVPINLARRIARELIEKGAITRAYLGISLDPPLDAKMAAKLGLPRVRGALVQQVFPDTPAAQAGLERLDVVMEFNGRPVEDHEHLTHMISMTPVGEDVGLRVWRNPQEKIVTARVGDRSKFPMQRQGDGATQTFPKLGIEVRDLTVPDRARLNLSDQKGVLITRTLPHSAAAQWLEPFDVIDQIEGRAIASVADISQAIRSASAEQGVRVRGVRPSPQGATPINVVVKI
jgi:serine protease Do